MRHATGASCAERHFTCTRSTAIVFATRRPPYNHLSLVYSLANRREPILTKYYCRTKVKRDEHILLRVGLPEKRCERIIYWIGKNKQFIHTLIWGMNVRGHASHINSQWALLHPCKLLLHFAYTGRLLAEHSKGFLFGCVCVCDRIDVSKFSPTASFIRPSNFMGAFLDHSQ